MRHAGRLASSAPNGRRCVSALPILTLAAGTALAVMISTPLPELEPTSQFYVADATDGSCFLDNVSTDGQVVVGTLIVGEPTGGGVVEGAVVFERNGSSWFRAAKLTGDDRQPSVGGGTAVVGSDVFGRQSGAWTREGSLQYFSWPGGAVDDGTIVSAGGRVYQRDAQWEQTATLMSDDGVVPRRFALRGDTAVGMEQGAAYVFGRVPGSTTWTQRARLTATDGEAPFDDRVSLTDGRIAIGAADGVHIFALDDGSWTEEAKLPSSYRDLNYGDLSYGALRLSGATLLAGSVVFRLSDGTWTARGLVPGSPAFGGTIAVHGATEQHLLGTRTVAHHGGYEMGWGWEYDILRGKWVRVRMMVWNPDKDWTSEEPYYAYRGYVEVYDLTDLPPPLAPVTVEFSPRTATVGTRVTVTATGTSLGAKRGRILVLRRGRKPIALHVTRWAEGVAEGVVTKALPAGSYDVCVEQRDGRRVVEQGGLSVVAPQIASVAPASGRGRTNVVATCAALGTTKGSVYLQAPGAGRRVHCKVTAWPRDAASGTGQGEVRFRVPKRLAAGTAYDVIVKNAIGEARVVGAFTAGQ